MYQLEIKNWLVKHRFNPIDGWTVTVDVDAMERAHGGKHPDDKKERVKEAENELIELGAKIGAHPRYGRTDVVAEHSEHGVFLVEVEGTSSKQTEQAMYSALGQTVLLMKGDGEKYLLAVPDNAKWERQVQKIPEYVRNLLSLSCVLVSKNGVRETKSAKQVDGEDTL